VAIERNSAFQFRSKRRIPWSVERDLIFLVHFETRMTELLRQFAVIRQKQQTLSLRVQTSDREEVGKFSWYEIKDGVTRVRILSSRNESGGFIQHDRQRRSGVNKLIIDFDVVARSWLRTEVCANFAIDCDAAGSDQFIAMPA